MFILKSKEWLFFVLALSHWKYTVLYGPKMNNSALEANQKKKKKNHSRKFNERYSSHVVTSGPYLIEIL